MFISFEQIRDSLKYLEEVHPFFGVTFLVCKKLNMPVGEAIEIPLDLRLQEFVEQYYKPCRESELSYRCLRLSDRQDRWIKPKRYTSILLINIDRLSFFKRAIFIHQTGTKRWGWKKNYIESIKSRFCNDSLIPIFHLAVWLYREKKWPSETTTEDIIKYFIDDFLLNEQEIIELFDISLPEPENINYKIFQEQVVSWKELKTLMGKPPDILPEEGTLTYLEIQGVGAARKLFFEPGNRLNLITGDNGLGKTFLLECVWWALTGQWASLPAYPMQNVGDDEPKISFEIAGNSDFDKESISYNWQTQRWGLVENRLTIPGLLIYARVDGSFAIWDSAKQYWSSSSRSIEIEKAPRPFVFTKDEVWNGQKDEKGNTFINGLLQDWIQWQSKPEKYPFETLVKVLERLSPPAAGDLGTLKPGEPVRLPFDAREFPTIEHPYGTVPIVHASAGVQRIITIAYLIVWAWEEHKIQSKLIRREPQKRMVILVDELEAHLHPQWQRVILPALLDVRDDLADDLQVQIMVATHSPLVMASVESRFDKRFDKLFSLELVKSDLSGNEVQIQELPFIRQGVVDSWLMSDVFKLRQARSLEAEKAIEAAKALQLSDNPNSEDVARVSEDLARYLSEDDEFWPRWVYFAEQHGVDL
jgi:hypothetical protein